MTLMLRRNRFYRLSAMLLLCQRVPRKKRLQNFLLNFLMKLTTMTTKQRLLLKTLPKESQLELLKELSALKQKRSESSPSQSDFVMPQ